jgi:hypothetical protein
MRKERLMLEIETVDGVLNFPLAFHNAYMYAQEGHKFFNPVFEAYFQWVMKSLEEDLKKHGLVFVAWAWVSCV